MCPCLQLHLLLLLSGPSAWTLDPDYIPFCFIGDHCCASTQLCLSRSHAARLCRVDERAYRQCGHLGCWPAPLHGAALFLLLPGTLLFPGLQRAFPCCWIAADLVGEVPGSWHAALRTASAAVCPLTFPVLHQTATEAGGNLLHPHQDCAISGGYTTSQGVGSGCACPQTKLITSTFPGVSFQVLSFSSVQGALIASGMSSDFSLTNFLLLRGQSRGKVQFLQCSSCSALLGFGALAASLNLAGVC